MKFRSIFIVALILYYHREEHGKGAEPTCQNQALVYIHRLPVEATY